MKKKTRNDIALGFFVIIGLLIFIIVIYYMGKQTQLLGTNLKVTSVFNNVSGLKSGNNVRFSGIKVGIVDQLEIISDSSVEVTMIIEKDAARFIKKDGFATIESEGLMGNKIVTISGGSSLSTGIEDGDNINSRSPVGIDAAIQTFMETAQETNLMVKQVTELMGYIREGRGVLGMIVSDTSMEKQFREVMANINESSSQAMYIVQSLKKTTEAINQGNGLATRLLYDTTWAVNANQIIDTAGFMSENLAGATAELLTFSRKLNNRKGTIDKLLTDSVMAGEIEMTVRNLRHGSENIDGAVNAIANSWLLNLFSGNRKKKKKDAREMAREDEE
ncbi:MAG: MCE family protein [Cyclobacteriaceae bacterium]|nr:MCE family protein [Cyclobacteriaceae bacterium]